MVIPVVDDALLSGLAAIRTRQDFARELTALRGRADLTVRGVAKTAGVQSATIGDWFSGRGLPATASRELLVRVLRVCGVNDDELIEQWLRAWQRVRRAPGPRAGGVEPYRGLAPFEREHVDWFFGRKELTKDLVKILTELHATGGGMQMVVGASGSGKSSLLRAGVVPALRGNGPARAAEWLVELFTPGARPMDGLAAWLAARIGIPDDELAKALRHDPTQCAEYARQAAFPGVVGPTGAEPTVNDAVQSEVDPTQRRGLVIIVDQFEESFTACDDEDERSRFIAALCAAADSGGAVVVIGLRADFYAQALRHPPLLTAIQSGQFTVRPMNEVELRDAIVEPARKAKIEVGEGLVELLLREVLRRGDSTPEKETHDAGELPPSTAASATTTPDKKEKKKTHDAGVLPLLSHALHAMWQQIQGNRLTIADYRKIGGIDRAVADSADSIYNKLTTSQQEVARRLFLSLVHIAPEAADTRRRVTTTELLSDYGDAMAAEMEDILDRFVDERLITMHTDTVEISHDALLTAWPKLRDWLNTDRAELITGRNLIDAAIAWNRDNRDPGGLYQGTRLAVAQNWAEHHRDELTRLMQEFLDSSGRHARNRKRLKRGLIVALALTTVLAVTVAVVAVALNGRIEQQNRDAVSQQLAAQAHEVSDANPRASALLALAAWDTSQTPEARGAVLSLQNHPFSGVAGVNANIVASNDTGNLIAVAYTSGTLEVRDNKPHPLTNDIGKIYRIAFGADTTLAAAGDRGIAIWTDPVHNPVGTVVSTDFANRDGFVSGLTFAGRNLDTLYAANTNGTIQRWHGADGRWSAGTPISVGNRVTAVAAQRCVGDDFKDKQCLIAAADDTGNLQLRDADTGDAVGGPIETAPNERKQLFVYSLAFSPDGDSLAIAGDDRSVHLWSIDQSQNVGDIDAHSLPVRQLVFVPDRDCKPNDTGVCVLATVGDDGIRVWNISRDGPGATSALLARLESQGSLPTSAAFVNQGDNLISATDDGSIAMWNVDRITVDGAANALAFDSAANADMAVANGHGHIDLLPAGKEESISVNSGSRGRNYVSIAYGPAGGRWAAAGDGKNVYVSEGSHGHLTIPIGGSPLFDASDVEVTSVMFGTDNDTLYTGDHNGHVKKWSVHVDGGATTATPLKDLTIEGDNTAVVNLTISADRAALAATFSDGTVRLWRTATDEQLRTPVKASKTVVYSVAFSPDHSTFFTGDADGVIRRWDTAIGTQIGSDATGHSGPVVSLAIKADGRTLASASHDHTVRIWTVEPGQAPSPFANLVGHTDKVNTVAFQPNTDALFSGSDDRSILRWNLDVRAALQAACEASRDDIADEKAWERLVPSLSLAEYGHMCDEYRTAG